MKSLRGYAIAAVAVAVASGINALLGPLHLANGSMFYLAAVLVVAIAAGRGPAIVAAAGSFVAFNYLFTEPRFSLVVNDPDDVVALLTFLLVAVVTSQLAAALRERVELAGAREREARLLHDLAALLATRPLRQALEGIAERIHAGLEVDTVRIELDEPRVRPVLAGDASLLRDVRAEDVLGPAQLDDASASSEVGRWRRVTRPHPPGVASPARSRRIPIPRSDGQAAGAMLLAIDEQRRDVPERLTRLLATVAGQIGIAAEQETLRRASTESELLRRTDHLRSRLLDAVSHDLRTPLASIIAAAGSLRQTDVAWSDEDRHDFAAAIEQEAERLNRIVGNLLDLGRIQDGTLVPRREWHDPAVVLGDAIERLRSSLPGRPIELDLPTDLPEVLLDAVEIDQVVANLVENAAHVSPPREPITVTARIDRGELMVAVEDRGPGLPPGPAERLFEPFVRGAAGSSEGGSGLGLAIARGLVDAHGGRIWAEDRHGGGARVAFSLPVATMPELDPA
jgi:two-component system, OmpR family, sensor histidine kinase KdpD